MTKLSRKEMTPIKNYSFLISYIIWLICVVSAVLTYCPTCI